MNIFYLICTEKEQASDIQEHYEASVLCILETHKENQKLKCFIYKLLRLSLERMMEGKGK